MNERSSQGHPFSRDSRFTVAVTGGTGFIGRHVLRTLLERNYRVRILSRQDSVSNASDLEIIPGELANLESLKRLVDGCHFVIHLAGIAHTSLRTTQDMARAHAVNVHGWQSLLSLAANVGAQRVVLASSAHVYASQSGMNIAEDAPLGSNNFYAQTKIEAENLGRQAHKEFGLEVVIARPCLTYGPYARFNLHALLRAIHKGYYFHIGGVNPVRSFLSVINAGRAFVHLLEHGVPGNAYNIADPRPWDLVSFVNDLAQRTGKRSPYTVPSGFITSAAFMSSLLRRFGLTTKIEDSLKKLTTSFSLSTVKLGNTGFEWDEDTASVRQAMVDAYLGQKSDFPEFQSPRIANEDILEGK